MKICGITAEYNPFHKGHAYQIEKARQAGATHILAVMSGNFVQRGVPAMLDKWIREKQKHTYVRINENWKNCTFKYPGWIKD